MSTVGMEVDLPPIKRSRVSSPSAAAAVTETRWDDAWYDPLWPDRAAAAASASGATQVTTQEVCVPVEHRCLLLDPGRARWATSSALDALAALPAHAVVTSFHLVAQALVRGLRLDQGRLRDVVRRLCGIEAVIWGARLRRRGTGALDILGPTVGAAFVRPGECPPHVREWELAMASEAAASAPAGTAAACASAPLVCMPFEMALSVVGSRDAVLADGMAYVSLERVIAMALLRVQGLVRAAVERMATWSRVDDYLDPRIRSLWARARRALESARQAETSGQALAVAAPGSLSVDRALELAPRCVQSAWAMLEKDGRLPNEYRPLLANFFRSVGVRSEEVKARWRHLLRARPRFIIVGYEKDIDGLYTRKHMVPSCETVLAARNKGIQCVSDVEDVSVCKTKCAIACGIKSAFPARWNPLVAFKVRMNSGQ